MKIGVLTSSRADYGIYLPLLKKMKDDHFFQLEIIAFGTHLSKFHGYTLNEIIKDNYQKIHTISSLLTDDDEQAISTSYGLTVLKFADFWSRNTFDLILCLGDRFEMSAAVQSSIPFRVKIAHIHGGETTLGAIDNIYRHQISLAAQLHFTSASVYREKVKSLTGVSENIRTVGALSLDGLNDFKPVEKTIFFTNYNIPDADYALVTFHPETVAIEENVSFADVMKVALTKLLPSLNLVITMPNADTMGSVYRKKAEELKSAYPDKVILVENFGKENYFSAMFYSKILIGNTSSGILEAASFGKYAVNVGDRQKGRIQSENVINSKFEVAEIISAATNAIKSDKYTGGNIYYHHGAADTIIKTLKEFNDHI